MAQNLASSATLWRPAGPKWVAYRLGLFAEWAALGQLGCFACGCEVDGPGAGEIEHRISARQRPDLAWSRYWQGERFLVPVHGSGRKRCPLHDLACNAVIGSNIARRDAYGRSLPLTPGEIAAAQARAGSRARSSTGRDRRQQPERAVPDGIAHRIRRVQPNPGVGRPWLSPRSRRNPARSCRNSRELIVFP